MWKWQVTKFASFFNNQGYIFDFTNYTWNLFTRASLGYSLQEKYGGSKFKSFLSFLLDDKIPNHTKYRFSVRLLDYYKNLYSKTLLLKGSNTSFNDILLNYENQMKLNKELFVKNNNNYNESITSNNGNYIARNSLSRIIDIDSRMNASSVTQNKKNQINLEELSDIHKTDYWKEQMSLLKRAFRSENSQEAIGKTKEICETFFKEILRENNMSIDNNWKFSEIVSHGYEALGLGKINANSLDAALFAFGKSTKGSICNFSQIRNKYGSGHGKKADFKSLPFAVARPICEMVLRDIEFLLNIKKEFPKSYNRNCKGGHYGEFFISFSALWDSLKKSEENENL